MGLLLCLQTVDGDTLKFKSIFLKKKTWPAQTTSVIVHSIKILSKLTIYLKGRQIFQNEE